MGLLRSNFRYTLQFLWQRFWNILDDFESIDSRSDEHHHFWWALQQKQSQTLGRKLRLSNGCQFCVSIGTPINRHKSIYVLFMRFTQRWQDSNFHCWSSSMLSLWETYTAITQPTKNQVPYFQTNPYRGFLFSQQIWLPWVLVHADGSYTQEGAQASAVGCPVHSFHFVPTCSYCVRLCPFGFMALLTPGRSYCQAQCLWASSCNIRVWAMPGSLLCRNGHWAMPEKPIFLHRNFCRLCRTCKTFLFHTTLWCRTSSMSMLSVEHKSSPINQSSKVYQARPTKCGIFCWLSLKDLQSLPAILSDVLKQWSTPQFVVLDCFHVYVGCFEDTCVIVCLVCWPVSRALQLQATSMIKQRRHLVWGSN